VKVTYGAIVQRASGKFGGTVHSNWKGVDVVRRFAKPSNPNSAAQQIVRDLFKNLTTMYTVQPSNVRAAWTSYATGKPFIARNKLIGLNVPLLQADTDWSELAPVPGDASTLPPTVFSPTGGVGQIPTSITAPTAPSGWTIAGAVACAIIATEDPTTGTLAADACTLYETEDVSAPYAPTISGLAAGDYFTWAFLKWTAPDGSTRYSAALSGGSAVSVT
jgi:hypothetical protein